MRRSVLALLAIAALALVVGLWRLGGGTQPPPAGTDGPAPPPAAAAVDAAADPAGAVPAGAVVDGVPDLRSVAATALEFAAERTGYRGRVVARDHSPVAGMLVRLFRGAPDLLLAPLDVFARQPLEPHLEAARAQTGGDGRFELTSVLPRGLCFLRLDFLSVQQAPPPWRAGHGTIVPVQLTPAPGQVVDLGDVMLKAGAVLTGRVVDEDGRPAAGALVRAARLPPLPFAMLPIERLQPDGAVIVTVAGRSGVLELPPWVADVLAALPIPTTTAAADGAFVLWGADPGDNVIAATTADRGSVLRQGVVVGDGATMDLGELRLHGGETAEVRVLDDRGAAIAGAEVVVAPVSTGVPVHIGQHAGVTDADGRVQQPGLPRGRVLAAARRSAKEAWTIGEPAAADRAVVVVPATCALTLSVLDVAGRVVRDVRLRLIDVTANAGAVELALFGLVRGVDLGGRLRSLEDGRLRIERLQPGSWCVVVGAAGHATVSVDVELRADTDRTVQLRAARALAVRVLDVAGAPVAAATIALQARGGSRDQRVLDMPYAVGRTDAQGRCLVKDLPTEETRISASHPLHGQVAAVVQGAPAELLLQFDAAAAISGRLTDGGRSPVPGRWVVVLERRYDGTPRPAVPELPQLALPDLQGAFEFAALQPGKYRLTAQDSVTDVGTVAGVVQYLGRRKQIFPWNKVDLDLHAGEHQQVRLDAMLDTKPYDGPGAEITGTVTIDGVPGDGALVVGNSKPPERNATSRVDRSGAFDLGRVPAGKLRVVVVPREVAESRLLDHLFSHHYARDIDVVDGQPQQLHIDVATGALSGYVNDAGGMPVAGCRIVLFDRGGEGRSSALRIERTDTLGAFRFAQLPAGTYELRAQKPGTGIANQPGVAVTAGGETGPLTIALQSTVRVQGRVQVELLSRRAPIGLTLHPLGGGEAFRGGAQPDGAFVLEDVPEGRYRVELQLWGDAQAQRAGELDVRAPAMTGVVLVPAAK